MLRGLSAVCSRNDRKAGRYPCCGWQKNTTTVSLAPQPHFFTQTAASEHALEIIPTLFLNFPLLASGFERLPDSSAIVVVALDFLESQALVVLSVLLFLEGKRFIFSSCLVIFITMEEDLSAVL